MSTLCYVNGEILSTSKGGIGISDLALQRGYGVFDYARTYNRKLFHFDDNLHRLRLSASKLHLKLPIPDIEITAVAEQLIRESTLNTPSIRLILTGGYSASPFFKDPNFIIIAEELPTYPASVYSLGVKLIKVEYQRELPHVKSINYMNSIRLEPLRREKNAFDILYYSENGVTECPRSNFFIFQGDRLVTPSSHVLHGITREIILKLASDHFPIEVRKIDPGELSTIDEAFITSTSKGIIPVTTIDAHKVGTGLVGDRTRILMRLLNEYTENY
ncbi:MAG: aminotransferase IV [Anaerolineae bacterium]|jgi:branched-subunit amino acid aminotransferase/4-amino-4-deoxychorismate lyase|nr:aminotransferase IV [Anaerolineae bacterium]MBT3712563.1 aminotransferase IV [Anaerolineae bacterium]MBT4312670.1 aminotransferase IV [Anaerolineae bacterium]MBT4458599.1 aminotransferase IV [Anaerolineae bacterium]MBT4843347.1 aminotransferase IV [Anaerolineae bacterium]